jgi:hypothetical protein
VGDSPEKLDDLGPLVREKPLDLKLKVLEQRLTIKLIAAIGALQVIPHLSIPGAVTAGAFAALAGKIVLVAVSR